MGFFGSLFGLGWRAPKVIYRRSKHDKIKAWAKTKPKSYWDAKKRK